MSVELDYMEGYTTNALAQAAYVSSGIGYASQYPLAQSDNYVKATTKYSDSFWAYYATDPTLSLIGSNAGNSWAAENNVVTNQRFHIDLGSAKIVTRIYYENGHYTGDGTQYGVKNFTFWGSNTASDFADLVYANNGTWVPLTISQSTFDQHVAADQADPKYITVTNTTAYRYYAFKFADTWLGAPNLMQVRRIELQMASVYSEATIKTQGSYSLKGVAAITDSLNKTLTRTVSPTIDLTGQTQIKFGIYASRTGSNIKLGWGDSGGTTTEHTPNIITANTWQTETKDVSGVSNADKDAINKIIATIDNADAANTFYLDNMFGTVKPKGIMII